MNDIQVWVCHGTLREDGVLKFTQSGFAVLDFKLHSRREYATKDGAKEEVLTADCSMLGEAAKAAAPKLKAGTRLAVRGRWKLNQWKDKNGQDRWRHVVSVDEIDVIAAAAPSTQPPAEPFDGGSMPF